MEVSFEHRIFDVEGYGTITGGNLANPPWCFCEENQRILDLKPGETARVNFKSGAGRTLAWVERIDTPE
jgi:hypothetical protein